MKICGSADPQNHKIVKIEKTSEKPINKGSNEEKLMQYNIKVILHGIEVVFIAEKAKNLVVHHQCQATGCIA